MLGRMDLGICWKTGPRVTQLEVVYLRSLDLQSHAAGIAVCSFTEPAINRPHIKFTSINWTLITVGPISVQ